MIEISGLTVAAPDGRRIIDGLDLCISRGRVTVVIGMSGSGKSTTARALTGRLPQEISVVSDGGVGSSGLRFGYVPQHPSQALGPSVKVGTALRDIAKATRGRGIHLDFDDILTRAALGTEHELLHRFPHQLSGGQQQRLVLAHALMSAPDVLVMDEPTTGQDSATRRSLLDEIDRLRDNGITVLLLTHDLGAARDVADEVAVMHGGRVVEHGSSDDVFTHPSHPAAREIFFADEYSNWPKSATPGDEVLVIRGLTARHGRRAVVEDFNLTLRAGTSTAFVGPSGVGKTTVARCIAGLHRPAAGDLLLHGKEIARSVNRRTTAEVAAIGYVFQDAKASLDPYRTVREQIVDGAVRLRGMTRDAASEQARALCEHIGLPQEVADRVPAGLSGGEAQRAAIARALAPRPEVLICDEVTTGLDPIARQRILRLLRSTVDDFGVALIMISHDSSVIRAVADVVCQFDRHDGTRRLGRSGSTWCAPSPSPARTGTSTN